VSGLHLFVGEEDLRIEEGVAALIEEVLPAEDRALNLDVLDAAEAEVGEIITRLDTLPFFGDRRVVVVKRLDALGGGGAEAMEAYLARGAPPTVAILTASAIDRRTRLFKVIQQHGTIHPCDPLREREVARRVMEEAKRAGKRMGPQAADKLVTMAGTGLRVLRLEVQKLAAYVGERPDISVVDVEAMATTLSETKFWTLTDAIGQREVGPAMQALEELLQAEHPLLLLATIAGHCRWLAKISALRARDAAGVAAALTLHPFRAGKLLEQARRYGSGAFPEIFALLEEADRAIKSTGQPGLALETLVLRLCGDPAALAAGAAGASGAAMRRPAGGG